MTLIVHGLSEQRGIVNFFYSLLVAGGILCPTRYGESGKQRFGARRTLAGGARSLANASSGKSEDDGGVRRGQTGG